MSKSERTEQRDAPDIELDRGHHDAHLNEEESGFDDCYPVVIHCRSEDEAREIAQTITDSYNTEVEE